MAGKKIQFGEDSRQAILAGVNKLADTVNYGEGKTPLEKPTTIACTRGQ